MAYLNFSERYLDRLEQPFTHSSFIMPYMTANIEFGNDKSVYIYTIEPIPMNTYNRTAENNCFGNPTEVGDTLQKFTMEVERSYSGRITTSNTKDQTINKVARFIRVQTEQVTVPEKDKYCFNKIIKNAGTIYKSSTAISADNVIERISAAEVAFFNNLVPENSRVLFVTPEIYNMVRLSKYFMGIDNLGEKAVTRGMVGTLFGMQVVRVPASFLSPGTNFVVAHKQAVACPNKLAKTRMLTEVPGYDGHQIEYHTYYDCFVLGHKAPSIYVDVNSTAAVAAAPTVTAAGAITVSDGYVAKYTTDGSDPRFSANAVYITASTSGVGKKGETIKAYQYKADAYKFNFLNGNDGNFSLDGEKGTVNYPSPVASAVHS